MSEYQYYEFQAVDRPLTDKEMGELRSYSTRGRITPTSFINDYSWGSFRGNEDAWMEKYFDAFLYLANWGTHVLKLRLPSRLLDPKTAKEYCAGDSASVRDKAGKVVLSFVSQDESGGGWLLRVQAGELDDEDIEPPVPPGLGRLSPSLESLAEFLRIDGDLLHVAAEASPSLEDSGLNRDEVRAWVRRLVTGEKDELIANLIVDADHALVTELLQRFLTSRTPASANFRQRPAGRLTGGDPPGGLLTIASPLRASVPAPA